MALSITIISPAFAQPGERVIGLLSLRQVQGPVCGSPPSAEIALYSTPERSDLIGWIRADRDADPAPDTDCYRVIVNVWWAADGRVQVLPTEEYEEEEPGAAIVVEQRGRWFKVQLPDGAAWLHASKGDEYFSLQQLLVKRPAYLTEAWDGRLAKAPGVPGQSARVGKSEQARGPLRCSLMGVVSRGIHGALAVPRRSSSHEKGP